jgi:hypothetical protein
LREIGRGDCHKKFAFRTPFINIPPAEFEKLAAVILRVLGYEQVFSTPSSHDRGVDAFGLTPIAE